MDKEIEIDKLQKEINSLEKRVEKLEIKIKNKDNIKINKKVKDPDAPKKPITAFIYYNKHNIDVFKKENPDKKVNVASICKESGKEWKTLKEDEKEIYLRKAIKDKERYEKEISLYNKKIK